MRRRLNVVVAAVIVFVSAAGMSRAETLLGSNYYGSSLGIVKFGDVESEMLFGKAYGAAALVNFNVLRNLDIKASWGCAWADGDDVVTVLGTDYKREVTYNSRDVKGDLIYFFRPGEKINPYLCAGVAMLDSETEVTLPELNATYTEERIDTGFGGSAGIEIDHTERVQFRIAFEYFTADGVDSRALKTGIGVRISNLILGTATGSYDFDSENSSVSAGLVLKL